MFTQTYLPGLTPDDGATTQEVVYGNGDEAFALGPDVDAGRHCGSTPRK